MRTYILNEHGEPVPEPDFLKWGQWFETGDRKVARTDLPNGAFISTVFLGLSHGIGKGQPILWETMVFNDKREGIHYERCAGSREQAEAMHQRMCDHFLK